MKSVRNRFSGYILERGLRLYGDSQCASALTIQGNGFLPQEGGRSIANNIDTEIMLNEIFMTVPDHRVTGRCTYTQSAKCLHIKTWPPLRFMPK